jgi:hypothetical protein
MAKKSDPTVDEFLRLSQVLTGETRLDCDLAEQYLLRIRKAFERDLASLLDVFRSLSGEGEQLLAELHAAFSQQEGLERVAQEIIMLWYMSGFRVPDVDAAGKPTLRELGPETPEQFFRGLFWPTVRAHPQGLSGGYFGYWKYPPEN